VDTYFKVMSRAIDECNAVSTLMEVLEGKGREAEPFISTLSDRKTDVWAGYEQVRVATSANPPDMDTIYKNKRSLMKAYCVSDLFQFAIV
jgi:hypothetical protein